MPRGLALLAIPLAAVLGSKPQLYAKLEDPALPVTTLTLSPDSKWLAAGTKNATMYIYHMHLGGKSGYGRPTLKATLQDDGCFSPFGLTRCEIGSLSFSADSDLLAASTFNSRVYVHRMDKMPPRLQTIINLTVEGSGPMGAPSVAISSTGLMAIGGQTEMRIYDITGASLKLVDTISAPSPEFECYLLAFSPDGHWLVNSWGHVYDVQSKPARFVAHLDGAAGPAPFQDVAFSQNGKWLATSDQLGHGVVRLYDASLSPPVLNATIDLGFEEGSGTITFSSDSRWLAREGAWTVQGVKGVTVADLSQSPPTWTRLDNVILNNLAFTSNCWHEYCDNILAGTSNHSVLLYDLGLGPTGAVVV